MKNYAGRDDVDDELAAELEAAGITVYRFPFNRDLNTEVKTSVVGDLHGWEFKRAWYYWVARGPGLPPAYAGPLHETHGQVVRVAGHCGCPSPLEWRKGFGVELYHVDEADGLRALADALRRCASEAAGPEKGMVPGLPRFPVGTEVWVVFPSHQVGKAVVNDVCAWESAGRDASVDYAFEPGPHRTYGRTRADCVFATEAEAVAAREERIAVMRSSWGGQEGS